MTTPRHERAHAAARARVARLEQQLADARAHLEAVAAAATAPLRGKAVADAAIAHRNPRDGYEAIHYSDWFAQVQGHDGILIAGEDPLATFLTAISRDPRIERAGPPRSGLYRVKP